MSPESRQIIITVESTDGEFKETHAIPREAATKAAVDLSLAHINILTSEQVLSDESKEALMKLTKSIVGAIKNE